MKDCPAELLVAICSEIDQSLLQFKSFASHCSWNHLRFKFVKELITADMAAIEQRDIELGIVAVQFAAFIQCTNSRTDTKMQIPQDLANLRNHFLLRVLAQRRSREKHQIDIGPREHLLAAVGSQRHQTNLVFYASPDSIPQFHNHA